MTDVQDAAVHRGGMEVYDSLEPVLAAFVGCRLL